MKCLSIREPFATLLIHGIKRFETRTWYTEHRGPLAIHAAKGRDDWQVETYADPLVKATLKDLGYPAFHRLPFGRLLGVAEITRIHKTDRMSPALYDGLEGKIGNFRPGRYAWQIDPRRRFDTPPEVRGQVGLWDLDDSIINKAQNG